MRNLFRHSFLEVHNILRFLSSLFFPATVYDMTDMLAVSHLSFTIDHKKILDDLSFSLEKGTFTLLCGRNGAGKSMLLKIVKGLLETKEGTITIEGTDLSKKRKERLKAVGLVFQDAATQIVGHTVEKDIRFGMDNLGIAEGEQKRRLDETTKLLHLDDKKEQDPRTLSGGEARRLAIAGVLVMKPSLLILDEPFAGLDWPSVKEVIRTLLDLKEKGTTILVVSHEAEKVLAYADHVLLLENGRLILNGKPEASLETLRNHDIYLPKDCTVKELTWLQ